MPATRTNFLSEGHKERIRNRIIHGARMYHKYLCNKTFMVLCDDGSEEIVRFYKEDFQHLTGLISNLSDCIFFEHCLSGTIDKGNISSSQKYDWSTLNKKSKRIENIHHLLYNDGDKTLLLEDLYTNTYIFPVAIKNIGTDICIGFVTKRNRARSLRNSRNSNNAKSEKKIVAIFAKKESQPMYDELVYISSIYKIYEMNSTFPNKLSNLLRNRLECIIETEKNTATPNV